MDKAIGKRRLVARVVELVLALALGGLVATPAGAVLVGATPGTFGVSAQGNANYHMPLTLPLGVGGLAPKISLDYTSGAGDLFMGPGWNLGGFSQIVRCSNTYAQDGVSYGVTGGTSDRYCLDGQQLKPASGANGGVGATYRTEIDNLNKVVSNGGSSGAPGTFTVQTKSGLTMTYGGSAAYDIVNSSGVIYVWLLHSTTDNYGNSITYNYSISGGNWWPTSVAYGGNTTTGTANVVSISFTWTARSGYIPGGYFAGIQSKNSNFLSQITADVNNSTVRHWNLAYYDPASGQYSWNTSGHYVLQSVTECAGSGTTDCANPTTFTWNSGPSSASDESLSYSGLTGAWAEFVGDANGDGFADLIGAQLLGFYPKAYIADLYT